MFQTLQKVCWDEMLSVTLSWKQMILCAVEHLIGLCHSTRKLFSSAFGVEQLLGGGLDGHLRHPS
jgi:hypothetical protein